VFFLKKKGRCHLLLAVKGKGGGDTDRWRLLARRTFFFATGGGGEGGEKWLSRCELRKRKEVGARGGAADLYRGARWGGN